MKNIITTFALKDEYVNLAFPECDSLTVITGVGKINSCMRLLEAMEGRSIDLVLNIGTAGTKEYQVGDILVCTSFIDRDYEQTRLPGLGFETETNIDALPAHIRQWKSKINGQYTNKTYTVNTGDNFVTDLQNFKGDAVDMEAYAQAIVCREKKIPFLSVKYITDIIGYNSVSAWQDKLADARNALTEYFKEKTL